MKKLILTAMLSLVLLSSVFSISLLEKMLLPEFTGDLSTVNYKVIDESNNELIVVIDGVTYIYKLNN